MVKIKSEDEKTLASLALALGVIIALMFTNITDFFAPYLMHSLFFVMLFSLLPFARHNTESLTKIHPVVMALVLWQQFLLPAAIVALGLFLDLDEQLMYFILISATSGSLFASPTLVQLMGLEQRMAVQSVVLSTLAAPISIYFSFNALQGGMVDLDMGHFAFRLFVFLVIPMAMFALVRAHIAKWSEKKKDNLDRFGRWASVISLIVFGFALENQAAHLIRENPSKVAEYLLLALTVAISIGVLTRIVMARFGPRKAATGAILASFRNVGLTFGLVGSVSGPELAVYVGVCQIPMFFAPLMFDLFIGKSRVPYRDEEGNLDMTKANNPMPSDPVPAGPSIPSPITAATAAAHAIKSSVITQSVPMTNYESHGSAALAMSPQTQYEQQPQAMPEPVQALPEQVTDYTPPLDENQDDLGARALQKRLAREHDDSDQNAAKLAIPGQKKALVYLVAFFAICVGGLAAIWNANKLFFPMLFDQQMIEQVAEAHSQGQNFGVYDLNINIRDLREATIRRMEKTPEVVVFGASHWQEAHVNLMPGRDLYNSHVHRDYYEDMMAVTEMWVKHDRLPKEIILTIRDNLLTPIPERTDFLWLPGIKYYRDFAKRIGFEPHSTYDTLPTNTWRELLSMPLLWGQAKHQLEANITPQATDKTEFEELDVLLPGGSILWSGEHKDIFTQERARKEALDFAALKRNNPPIIDPKGVEHMERLFEYFVANDIKVTLAHPQFNPVFWDAVQDSPYMEGLERVKKLTQTWANKYGFGLIGGFAPSDVGCKASQYIDAEHGDPACLGMLLAQYPYQTNIKMDYTLRGTVGE